MASKATAVLMRLREIDQKYKYRYEDKKNTSDSDDGDSGNDNGKNISKDKPTLEIYKPQLNIKIPDAYEDYLDTNSSNDNNDHSVAVRIYNDNDNKVSESLSQMSENVSEINKPNTESMREIDNFKGEKNNDRNIEVSGIAAQSIDQELSISENLDDVSNSIPELSKKLENNSESNLSLEITVESFESNGDEDKLIIDEYSKKSSMEKYSDDTFESNSSGENESENKLTPPVSLSSNKSEISINIEKVVEINTKETLDEAKNNNDTDINTINDTKAVESSNNYSQTSPEIDINNYTHEKEHNSNQISIASDNVLTSNNEKISTDASNSHIKNSIENNNKIIEHENSLKSTVQGDSSMSFRNSKKYCQDLITTQTKDKISYNNSEDKIGTKKYTKEKVQRHSRKKKYTEDDKREYTVNKKMFEQTMRRDNVRFRHEHERIHSTMIYYLEQMKEERRKLHLLWPNRLTCPERVDVGRIIKPLDFPNVASFIRPSDNSINQHPDPNMNILRNRLLDIRQWLKNQYLIYKKNCNVAASINKKYNCDFTVDTTKLVSEKQSNV